MEVENPTLSHQVCNFTVGVLLLLGLLIIHF